MQTIKFEAADGIGWLTLNRPERMNSMTNRMLVETHDCLAADRASHRRARAGAHRRRPRLLSRRRPETLRRGRNRHREFAASLLRAGAAARNAAGDDRGDQRNVRRRRSRLGERVRFPFRRRHRDVQHRVSERRIRRRHGRTRGRCRASSAPRKRASCISCRRNSAPQRRCSGDSSAACSRWPSCATKSGKIAARLAAAPPHALREMKSNFLDAEKLDFASVHQARDGAPFESDGARGREGSIQGVRRETPASIRQLVSSLRQQHVHVLLPLEPKAELFVDPRRGFFRRTADRHVQERTFAAREDRVRHLRYQTRSRNRGRGRPDACTRRLLRPSPAASCARPPSRSRRPLSRTPMYEPSSTVRCANGPGSVSFTSATISFASAPPSLTLGTANASHGASQHSCRTTLVRIRRKRWRGSSRVSHNSATGSRPHNVASSSSASVVHSRTAASGDISGLITRGALAALRLATLAGRSARTTRDCRVGSSRCRRNPRSRRNYRLRVR